MTDANKPTPAGIGRMIGARFAEHLRLLGAMDAQISGLLKRHDGKLKV